MPNSNEASNVVPLFRKLESRDPESVLNNLLSQLDSIESIAISVKWRTGEMDVDNSDGMTVADLSLMVKLLELHLIEYIRDPRA